MATGSGGNGPLMANRAQEVAREAKRRPLVRRLARSGLVARAVVYVLLAYLTARLAAARPAGQSDSTQGALASLVRQPGGQELVAVLCLGLLAYAGWRLLQALSGDPTSSEPAELLERIGWGAIGLAYLVLAGEAAGATVEGRANAQHPTSVTARVLQVPGGRELLFVIGAGVVAGGVGLVVWAVLQRFVVALPDRHLPGWVEPTVRIVGTYGNVARGCAFAAVGATLAAAAVVDRAGEAKGLGSALASLTHQPLGRPVLALVALGFLAFAALSALEAAYRKL